MKEQRATNLNNANLKHVISKTVSIHKRKITAKEKNHKSCRDLIKQVRQLNKMNLEVQESTCRKASNDNNTASTRS